MLPLAVNMRNAERGLISLASLLGTRAAGACAYSHPLQGCSGLGGRLAVGGARPVLRWGGGRRLHHIFLASLLST
eukprot:9449347-Alexandrium_andersonii.AAC.1